MLLSGIPPCCGLHHFSSLFPSLQLQQFRFCDSYSKHPKPNFRTIGAMWQIYHMNDEEMPCHPDFTICMSANSQI